MNKQQEPYKQLGERLKTTRQKSHESVADVAGAVEIDEPTLLRIEEGQERPSEDILMLLISHFDMQDDEAGRLWQLAGYTQSTARDTYTGEDIAIRATVLVMAPESRIMYSDGIQVTANNNNVVLCFTQNTGLVNPLIASRVGVNREQAQKIIDSLREALERSKPKQLPSSFNPPKNSKKQTT